MTTIIILAIIVIICIWITISNAIKTKTLIRCTANLYNLLLKRDKFVKLVQEIDRPYLHKEEIILLFKEFEMIQ